MHTIILVSIIGTLALLAFKFAKGGELLLFCLFLVCASIALVSLITLQEYKLAIIPGAILFVAFFRMWQSYKRFQE